MENIVEFLVWFLALYIAFRLVLFMARGLFKKLLWPVKWLVKSIKGLYNLVRPSKEASN